MPTMPESAKTAIARVTPSMPLQYALLRNLVIAPVLDWGCGRGADVQCLQAKGIEVYGYDPYWQPDLPPHRAFASGQCIYVLNVIRSVEERLQSLQQLRGYLAPGASLLVAVRAQHAIRAAAVQGSWDPVGEGYLTRHKTYQEGFTDASLQALLVSAAFANVQTRTYRDTVLGFARNE